MITPELPNNYADKVAERIVRDFRFGEDPHYDYACAELDIDLSQAKDIEGAEKLLSDFEEGFIVQYQEKIDDGLEVLDRSPVVVTADEINQFIDKILAYPNGTDLDEIYAYFKRAGIEEGLGDFMLMNRIKKLNPKLHEVVIKNRYQLMVIIDIDKFGYVKFLLQLINLLENTNYPDEYYALALKWALTREEDQDILEVDDYFLKGLFILDNGGELEVDLEDGLAPKEKSPYTPLKKVSHEVLMISNNMIELDDLQYENVKFPDSFTVLKGEVNKFAKAIVGRLAPEKLGEAEEDELIDTAAALLSNLQPGFVQEQLDLATMFEKAKDLQSRTYDVLDNLRQEIGHDDEDGDEYDDE